MTYQPAAVVGRVEKGCDTIEEATELGLRPLAGSSLETTRRWLISDSDSVRYGPDKKVTESTLTRREDTQRTTWLMS